MVPNRLNIAVLTALLILAGIGSPAWSSELQTDRPGLDKETPEVSPITLYQKIISRADGNRCPMHPSCSHYAQEALKRHGSVLGWVLTCDRLLRCGRDETRLAAPIKIKGEQHTYDPLSANTFWWEK